MRKSKNRKVAERMADGFHLPKDLMLGAPIVTITGRSDMTVENYRGILVY